MSKELWSQEYLRKGIPSSFRDDPTKVVTHFVSFLRERNLTCGNALDIGCGKGRNAFYLAESGFNVDALDWVPENVREINSQAVDHLLPITAHCQSVVEPWPLVASEVDIAIDIFCYKHIVDKNLQSQYRQHLGSALKRGGYYLISLAADDDGFYGPLLEQSTDPKHKLIIDPYSNIGSFLYNLDEITSEFSEGFSLVKAENTRSKSPMYGKEYARSVLNLIFQKR